MAVITPWHTPVKTIEITMPTPYENLQSTPTPLPTSEPTTPQVSYTVSSSDLPTFSVTPERVIYVCHYSVAGKNESGVTTSVRIKALRNGTEIYSSYVSVYNNYYWTITMYFKDVDVGDVLEIKLWADDSGVNWDYEGRQIQPSRVNIFVDAMVLYSLSFSSIETHPVFTKGSPGYTTESYYRVDHVSSNAFSPGGDLELYGWKSSSSLGLFRIKNGDVSYANGATKRTSSSYRPYYSRNRIPTKITVRALNVP